MDVLYEQLKRLLEKKYLYIDYSRFNRHSTVISLDPSFAAIFILKSLSLSLLTHHHARVVVIISCSLFSILQTHLAFIKLWITLRWTICMEQINHTKKAKEEQEEEEGSVAKPMQCFSFCDDLSHLTFPSCRLTYVNVNSDIMKQQRMHVFYFLVFVDSSPQEINRRDKNRHKRQDRCKGTKRDKETIPC